MKILQLQTSDGFPLFIDTGSTVQCRVHQVCEVLGIDAMVKANKQILGTTDFPYISYGAKRFSEYSFGQCKCTKVTSVYM